MDLRNLTHSNLRKQLFQKIEEKEFFQKFGKLKMISSGTQGKVFKGTYNDQFVAIKQFKNANISQYFRYIAAEIITLNEIDHENIIKLINCYQVSQSQIQNSFKYYMVMEFCQASLNDYSLLAELNTQHKLNICRQIVSAIKLAHQNNIMHRDIKPENVLIKDLKSFLIKVCDFGCSRRDNQGEQDISKTCQIGTPLYKDPNVQNGEYTNKCDVYSLGLLIMYIFFGKTLFSHLKSRKQLSQLQKKFYLSQNIESQFAKESSYQVFSQQEKTIVKQILKHTLNQKEKQRYSSSELLSHIQKEIQKLKQQKNQQIPQIQNSVPPMFKKKKTDQTQQISVESFEISNIQRVQVQYLPKFEKAKPNPKSTIQQISSGQIQLKKSYNSQKSQTIQKKKKTDQNGQKSQQNQTQNSLNNEEQEVFVERFTANQNSQNQQDPQFSLSQKQFDRIQKSAQDNKLQTEILIMEKQNLSQSIISSRNIQNSKIASNQNTRDESLISQELILSLTHQKQLMSSSRILPVQNYKLDNCDKMVANLIQQFDCIYHKQAILSFEAKLLKLVNYNKKVFSLIKPRLQAIIVFNKETKQGLAFMYHLLYRQFLQNIINFVNKKPSTISKKVINDQNLSINQIAQLSQKFENIADKQKLKIDNFMKSMASSLQPKVRLIQPKLSDFMIKQIRSMKAITGYQIASLQQKQIKDQIMFFIEQRVGKTNLNEVQAEKIRNVIQILRDFK